MNVFLIEIDHFILMNKINVLDRRQHVLFPQDNFSKFIIT